MLSIPRQWSPYLEKYSNTAAYTGLLARVEDERRQFTVFPPEPETFSALELTAPDAVKVVILGQDPYHEPDQAHGLAFSVPESVKIPPSLRNIYKELAAEFHWTSVPESGDLRGWAAQGVLLLNTVLTVRAHQANSHRKLGWEGFTDEIIRQVNIHCPPTVFLLWGAPAQKKRFLIDEDRHLVLCCAHPSPLSAYRGFFDSNIFIRTNEFLCAQHREPIDWARTSAG